MLLRFGQSGNFKDPQVDESIMLYELVTNDLGCKRLDVAIIWVDVTRLLHHQWPLGDGPIISMEFNKYMFRQPGNTSMADALNVAIRVMRKKPVSLKCWIMFVHIGA